MSTATATSTNTATMCAFASITAAEATAASNLYWYFQNYASITADLALHCDLAPATVYTVVGNIIEAIPSPIAALLTARSSARPLGPPRAPLSSA